ncbi:MAG TPA: BON domain-containing protein [Thermoleophilaceae bacterium]|jgi:hypothetical protein
MNFNSLITGPARLGLTLAARGLGLVRGRFGTTQVDDTTLQRSVEAEVFASRRAPKGQIEVNVTEGVVWLRGEVKTQSAVNELESRARSVEGVARVENLLRVAKPAKSAKPAARAKTQAKTQKRPAAKRSSRPKPAAATAPPPQAEPVADPTPPPAAQRERKVTRRFNAERTAGSEAEPTPRDLSDAGKGRQPAPLGADEPASPATAGAAAAAGEAPATGSREPAGVGSPAAPFPTTGGGSGSSENGSTGNGGSA